MLRIGRIHVLTDTSLQTRFSHVELAKMAFEGGIPVVQYRRKDFDREKHIEELYTLVKLARAYKAQLIVNDYLDVAVEVGATGVHLGESDTPIAEVFFRIPPFFVVGATVHSLERYAEIRHLPIAYVGVGPVFETQTKDPGYPPLGIEGLRAFVEAIAHPVIAIGGITPQRAKELFDAIPRLHGVAVLSAFCTAQDPVAVARELLQTLPSEGR